MLMRSTSPWLGLRQALQGSSRSAGTSRRRSLQILWSVITFVAIVFGALPQAQAHDAVVASTPADGAVVASFPREFELEFSGIPQQSFNTVAVSDAQSGEVLFTVEPTLDQQFVRFETPADVQPEAGEYIIGFQITSSDGHAVANYGLPCLALMLRLHPLPAVNSNLHLRRIKPMQATIAAYPYH